MGQGKVAVVTGGSRGIGRGIAEALGREHVSVVINYNRAKEAAAEVLRVIESAGGNGLIVQCDISVADDRERLVEQTLASFGKIDLLVNNAGVAPDVRADVLEATEESFDRLMNINLKGPYFLTQRVANAMIKAGSQSSGETKGNESRTPDIATRSSNEATGATADLPRPKIINITSISAYTAHTHRGDYAVSKAGLAMMTQVYAARLAEHGINVYEIRPGIIATDMTGGVKQKYDDLIFNGDLTPIKRWGTPEDVARAVVAIANDYFPFSTGEIINVDGGFHMRRL